MRRILAATVAIGLCGAAAPQPSALPSEFGGIWWHPSLPGPEPLASGPTTVTNRSRHDGVSDYGQLVGDYTNPILKPEAAAVVKKFGDMSLAGEVFGNPANQCWPEPVPFIYKNFGLQIFDDHHGELTLIYDQDHEVRHVHMNSAHARNMKPSWYGDSVGHMEGDTLVIDTIGTKADRPFAMIDLYGTPYTKALHVVERYRLVSYEEAKDGIARDEKENMPIRGIRDPNYRGKYLELSYTVEDQGVFTMPWSATVTFGRGTNTWPETVCAENAHSFAGDEMVPTAARPDF